MKSKGIQYLIRIGIATFFHCFYRLYDETFHGEMISFETRSVVFYFFFVSYLLLVWEIGTYIFKATENKYKNNITFRKKSKILLLIYLCYGIIVSIVYGIFYYLYDVKIFGFTASSDWDGIAFFHFEMNMGIFIFYAIIVTVLGYMYYFNHWQQEKLITEQLKKENIQSKYEALKNQIDPHFFFNSLSALASLNLKKNHELSAKYIDQLSKMYRYILDKDKKSLVTINEELQFLKSYIFLIKVRHKEFINFNIDIAKDTKENIYIPPNTLQMLAENAIKHNKFSKEEPLIIEIFENDNSIVIRNNLNKRLLIERSSEIGLENIQRRYELLVKKDIIVEEKKNEFIVTIPKLNIKEYESVMDQNYL